MNKKQKETAPTWRGQERAGYTPKELIQLGIGSRSFIYAAIAAGKIRAVRIGPRKLIIPAAAVEEFLLDDYSEK